MGTRASYEPGTFSWVDLATTDPDGAKGFYGELFGWVANDAPVGDGRVYTMLSLGEDSVAALYEMMDGQRESGMPPSWLSYVTVADADDAAARAHELGGTVHMAPFEVMEAGRMAVVGDPTGAVFAVWEPREAIGATRVNDIGCLTWNELATADPEAARAFYAGLFGWDFEAMDTGDAPGYWIVAHSGAASGRGGGIREQGPQEAGVPPHWLPYFTVGSPDAAAETAEARGGGVLAQPMDLPAGRIAVLRDPAGAVFGVFAGDVDD